MKGLLRLILLGGMLSVLACCGFGMLARQDQSNSPPATGSQPAGPTAQTPPAVNQPPSQSPGEPSSPEMATDPTPPSRPVEIPASLDRTILAQLKQVAADSDARRKQRVEALRLKARNFRTSNRTRDAREVTAQADRLEKSRSLIFDSIRAPYQVGELGFLQEDIVQVISIAGSSDFVGMIEYGDFGTQFVWLSGWNTDNLLNGSKMRVDDLIRVTGSREYTTVLGATNRVAVIEPFNHRPYMPYVLPEAEPEEVVKPEPTPEELREKELRAASAKLRLAKQLLEKDETEKGREWLKELVREFPDTPAAKEAAELLQE